MLPVEENLKYALGMILSYYSQLNMYNPDWVVAIVVFAKVLAVAAILS